MKVEILLAEFIGQQEKKLLALGRRLVPTLTPEDILQPNDFNELEHNPYFRYEEGLLAGMLTVQAAIIAWEKERGAYE